METTRPAKKRTVETNLRQKKVFLVNMQTSLVSAVAGLFLRSAVVCMLLSLNIVILAFIALIARNANTNGGHDKLSIYFTLTPFIKRLAW